MSFSTYIHIIISYIEAHIKDSEIDYRELERLTGYSLAHIRDLFKRRTGSSLAQYIRMRKINSSACLLLHSKMTIMNIALIYGFSNHESYTRAFKKVTGMTPSQFRQERPIVGKKKLTTDIYSIGFLDKMEQRSDMQMNDKYFKQNDSTILYGVPRVCWETGSTPFPNCLKACANYLGEDVDYAFSMVSSGAAFRLVWNKEIWDLSNVDIYHTFSDSPGHEVYKLGAEAMGREFDMLIRHKETKKEEFMQFIKKHIDEGYPCIALGIIGPPEACVITGYRNCGEVLLGWNFFQDDPDFAANVEKDESGYFVSDKWWENTDTHAVMCVGPIIGEHITEKQIIKYAISAMTGRKEFSYYKGVWAYQVWRSMLEDNKNFDSRDTDSRLFEKFFCQNDAMTCLIDGRGNAAVYFDELAKQNTENSEKYKQIAEAFSKTKEIVCKMQKLFGGWEDVDGMLRSFADENVRKKACEYIEQARISDEQSLKLLIEADKAIVK